MRAQLIGTDAPGGEPDLGHHGDAEATPGLVDLAVNVRRAPMPDWLADPLVAAMGALAAYPDPGPARAAVAARHGRPPEEVLLTAGAAEGFVLIARALREARRPVVVHPQFTEPEAALRAAGHTVERVLLDPAEDFRLDPARVPADADLVLVGNPTNPTSVLHPAGALAALARPGRVLVVDEAFADTTAAPGVEGEPESLAARRDLPGLLVVRSLTKTWGLAGLRIGYLLGDPGLLARFGVGEAPLGWQGTVSVWRDAADLVAFAYRHPEHRAAITRTPTEGWYAEELFARFAVGDVVGDRTVLGWAAPAGDPETARGNA
ncbi:putative aminotransferase [Micromonospora sp. MH33]|uniref:Rv2231c family pyridoxal phosphate-dependent protein CobC n=1 Tax=Micromonospora sp. MH33 TaxID=1945509 RepID=UPI000D2A5283|nr:Rv2231c family pyridoxal phosphate-dependent protein CobC [Micromonospora sp. MH33]PSK62064.1 putative aminotransferase [Micromonospora sp. MH33]